MSTLNIAALPCTSIAGMQRRSVRRRKGASARKRAAKGGAKNRTSKQNKGAKGNRARLKRIRRFPKPPRRCELRRPCDIVSMPESTPATEVFTAFKAAAVAAAAAAAQPACGTARDPPDPVLQLVSWLHRRTASRTATMVRHQRIAFDTAKAHLRRAEATPGAGADVPIWAEEALMLLPFSTPAQVVAAVDHRVTSLDVLQPQFNPRKPYNGDGPSKYSSRSRPAPAARSTEAVAQWRAQQEEARRVVLRDADTAAMERACGETQPPPAIRAALHEQMLLVGKDSRRLVEAAPMAAVMKTRAATTSALKAPDVGGPSWRARKPAKHVRLCLQREAEAAVAAPTAALWDSGNIADSEHVLLPGLAVAVGRNPGARSRVTVRRRWNTLDGTVAAAATTEPDAEGHAHSLVSPRDGAPNKRRKCGPGAATAVPDAAGGSTGGSGGGDAAHAGGVLESPRGVSPFAADAPPPPSPPQGPDSFNPGATSEAPRNVGTGVGAGSTAALPTHAAGGTSHTAAHSDQHRLERGASADAAVFGGPATGAAEAAAVGSAGVACEVTAGATRGDDSAEAGPGNVGTFMTDLERERQRRQEANKNRLELLQAELQEVFGAPKAAKKSKPRKVRPSCEAWCHALCCTCWLRLPRAPP